MKKGDKKVTDLSYLKRVSAGNTQFIKEMIDIFLRQTPQFLQDLFKYEQEQNWQEFRKVMHKLKPTITMMGIQMEETIKKIEESSKEMKDLERLPESLNELKMACEVSYDELRNEVNKGQI